MTSEDILNLLRGMECLSETVTPESVVGIYRDQDGNIWAEFTSRVDSYQNLTCLSDGTVLEVEEMAGLEAEL